MESFSKFLVDPLELFDFAVALGDCIEKLRVSGFALQEAFDERVNIGDAGGGLNLFKGFVNGLRIAHFFFHFFAHEGVPQLVDHQFVSPFKLGRILVLAGSFFSNYLVLALALYTSVN